MPIYEIKSFKGGLSQYEDKGIPGAFKFATNLDIRKRIDSISANQALTDEGLIDSSSPSASVSPRTGVNNLLIPTVIILKIGGLAPDLPKG